VSGGAEVLQIDVLGPIRARDRDGRDVTPDGALQRRLLALLVLHRGTTVSADTAVDALWPEGPPRGPTAALHTHLSRLRRSLPEGIIESTESGYRLASDRVDLDADRLAAVVTGARATDPAAGLAIEGALDRWRGPAYPELGDVDAGRMEAARLEELRILAVERRAEAGLHSGATDELVVQLAALAEEHPLRERPRELLMAALASSGRTAEALRVYDDFRRLLSEELGIEPSAALTAQHAELLQGTSSATWSPPHRLPEAVTSLLGRDDLLSEATALVEEHRLVTLLGPGGVGKTRLMVAIGHHLRAARPERPVVLVELASATEESAVDEVAAALAIDGRPDVGLGERLAAVLADLEVVLLLDNCEHVLDPVAELVDRLLAACPNVTMVATTRERLRVGGEHLIAVPPLPLDDGADPATRLFIERGQAVSPGFEPSAKDVTRISEIVRRLDGLPLAIELAAARLLTLDVSEVAAGLDRRFRLLTSGSRTSSRHGSLSAAVAWSVGLLDPDLRRVFANVSVFAGSFTVGDTGAVSDLDRDDAAAALDQLAERSLVMRAPGRRYLLLETLRAFGAELLEHDGLAAEARDRHAHHVVERIEAADRAMLDPGREGLFALIDSGLPELRNALGWLLEQGDVERAGRLVTALQDYGFFRLRPDVLAWSERVIEADPDALGPLADIMWEISAMAAWMAGDLEETGVRTTRAAAIADARGLEPPLVATTLGSYALFEGRLVESAAHYRRAADAATASPAERIVAIGSEVLALAYANDPRTDEVAVALLEEVGASRGPHAAYAWYCAGEADLGGDVDRARARLDVAIEIADATGASFISGVAGTSRASIEARVGDPAAAAEEYRRLITHWRRAGVWSTQWTMLRSVAVLLESLGRPSEAAVLVGAVLATHEGHRIFGADETTLTELTARLRATLGDDGYEAATARGAVLDGHAAAEHALRSL
jgi:predicted ATPase/DNA-binding SARP family transcriptional activator